MTDTCHTAFQSEKVIEYNFWNGSGIVRIVKEEREGC
jgi:hypothetical protein